MTPVGSAALVLGLVLLLGACGDADSTYVEEQGSGLFMRLPADWTVFPVENGKPAVDPGRDSAFGVWSVLIDGAERPDRAHGEEANPEEPVGTVTVVPLAMFQSPPPLAHAALRGFFTGDGSDPLEETGIDDLEYEEIDLGDHWGNRITGTVTQGADTVRISQMAFFDAGGDRIHLVRIMCSLGCFEEHEVEIDAALDSFTLEG